MLVARRALEPCGADLRGAADAAAALARPHRDTPMIGRTLLQQAVPTTFGLVAAGWLPALDRAGARLAAVRATASRRSSAAPPARWPARRATASRCSALRGRARPGRRRSRLAHRAQPHRRPGRRARRGGRRRRPRSARDIVLLAQTEVGEVREAAGAGRLVGDAAQAQPDRGGRRVRGRAAAGARAGGHAAGRDGRTSTSGRPAPGTPSGGRCGRCWRAPAPLHVGCARRCTACGSMPAGCGPIWTGRRPRCSPSGSPGRCVRRWVRRRRTRWSARPGGRHAGRGSPDHRAPLAGPARRVARPRRLSGQHGDADRPRPGRRPCPRRRHHRPRPSDPRSRSSIPRSWSCGSHRETGSSSRERATTNSKSRGEGSAGGSGSARRRGRGLLPGGRAGGRTATADDQLAGRRPADVGPPGPPLTRRHRMVRYDTRGHGRSPLPRAGTPSPTSAATRSRCWTARHRARRTFAGCRSAG